MYNGCIVYAFYYLPFVCLVKNLKGGFNDSFNKSYSRGNNKHIFFQNKDAWFFYKKR